MEKIEVSKKDLITILANIAPIYGLLPFASTIETLKYKKIKISVGKDEVADLEKAVNLLEKLIDKEKK